MKQTEFKTKRLVIRPILLTDYKTWFDAYVYSLPPQTKWDSPPYTKKACSLKIFKSIIAEYRRLAKDDDYYRYGIFLKKSDALIGHIDYKIYERGSIEFANYGYRIYNRHWSQGYGQEAAKKGLLIGFKDLKLNRLEAAIDLDNKKSIRLVKAIGMYKEGVRKKFWLEKSGWMDQIMYVAHQ